MDLNILHLSDLHISTEFDTMQNLLDDIKEQMKDLHDIIVVVTGDIVNQGNYDIKTKNNVLIFFQNLQEILGDKFKSCFIVPGNHDKCQSASDSILTSSFKERNPLTLEQIDLNYQLLAYEKFLDLEDEIFSLFSRGKVINPIHFRNTYGVEVYQNYESAIIFIKIDTSWYSLGGYKDKRNLRIAKSQLDSLRNDYKEKYKENKNKKIFTIALCHHPINWLTEEDESMLYSYLTNNNYLNADVLLCGHTHDVNMQNLFSNTHQLTTLVTGIGWPEKTAAENRNGHRYSYYVFNLRRNSCEVIVRKTDMRGAFDIDRDFFPDKESKDKGRLSLPILPRNSHPFIKIPTCSQTKLHFTPLFIDNNILNNIKEYFEILSKIKIHMAEFISQLNRDAIVDFKYLTSNPGTEQDSLRNYFYNSKKDENIDMILRQNNKIIFQKFTSLLCEFCNIFILGFRSKFINKDNFRILFRIYDDKEYRQICFQSKLNLENKEYKIYKIDNLARNLKFDGIIEKSYTYNSPLVYSSNIWYNSFEPARWDNFLCVIPNYKNMQLFQRDENNIDSGIPFLVCTISTCSENEKDSNFLDILNYIDIQSCISYFIKSFVNIYNLDFTLYCNYLRSEEII